MLKIIFSLIALGLGAVFGLFFRGSGLEIAVVTIASSIAGAYGVTNWRKTYDLAKEWFKSKTIIGALSVAVPILALVVIPLFGVVLPDYVVYLLTALIIGGGGATLWGIFGLLKTDPK